MIIERAIFPDNGYLGKIHLEKDTSLSKYDLFELNLENEDILDYLLRSIKKEYVEGNTVSGTRYKDKHPKRWFNHLYPTVLEPHVIGIGLLDEIKADMIGWFSVMRTASKREWAQFGIIIDEKYRRNGIGKAALQCAIDNLSIIFNNDDAPSRIALTTLATNEIMQSVATALGFKERNDLIPNKHNPSRPQIVYLL